MSDKIADATPEQWEEIRALQRQWVENTTLQFSFHKVIEVAGRMYRDMGHARMPICLQTESPLAMVIWSALTARYMEETYPRAFNDRNLIDQEKDLFNLPAAKFIESKFDELPKVLELVLVDGTVNDYHIAAETLRDFFTIPEDKLTGLKPQLREFFTQWAQGFALASFPGLLQSKAAKKIQERASRFIVEKKHREDLKVEDADLAGLDGAVVAFLRRCDAMVTDCIEAETLRDKLKDQPYYLGMWWRCWSGWYAGAKILGVEFDEHKYNLFLDWNEYANTWSAYEEMLVTSLNPIECHWEGESLHTEEGPSVRWKDGYSLWNIEGVAVDEQIVMRPETQTLEQIEKEENAEVRRIRIRRYTWDRYLKEVGAEVIDKRVNDIDGSYEALFKLKDDRIVFSGQCRSTGRIYHMVVENVKTCQEAQNLLNPFGEGVCIGAA